MDFKYPVINVDDVDPEVMPEADGWRITEFRIPLSKKQGCTSTMFHARFDPKARHEKHRHDNCDEYAYVIKGTCYCGVEREVAKVRQGDFQYIPKGVEHWAVPASEELEVVGIYVGAGSLKETGYVFLGEVTEEDLKPCK